MSYAPNVKTSAPAKIAAIRILGILALSLAGAGLAQANQHLTREQVQAEMIQAQRTGDIVEPWTQKKLNELYPSEYPTKAVTEEKKP
jgi:hypothetical protein